MGKFQCMNAILMENGGKPLNNYFMALQDMNVVRRYALRGMKNE